MRVDGAAYSILGKPSYSFISQQLNVSDANITNRVTTPTQIILTAQAGPMQVNVTFLNPVEVRCKFFDSRFIEPQLTPPFQPRDWVRQSIPFSYLFITAKSLDNSTHNMEVYSDFGPCM